MVNEDYTYFELTARDGFLLPLKIIGICWVINVFLNILFYSSGGWVSIFIISQCICTIILIYLGACINEKNRNIKELIIDEDGIFLKEWYTKKGHNLKWYQIKSVQIKYGAFETCNWGMIVYSGNEKLHFLFTPYLFEAKPKNCIKVLKNCVDVKKKLVIE